MHADHHAFAARTLFELAPRLGSALALPPSHDSQMELVLYPQKSMRDQLSNVTIFACLRKLRSTCSLLCLAIAAYSLLRSACNLLCFAIAACSLLVRDGRKPRGRSRVGFDVVEAQRAYL